MSLQAFDLAPESPDAAHALSNDSTTARAISRRKTCDAALRGSKLLVIDEDESNLAEVRRQLAAGGFHNVVVENDSTAALRRVSEMPPDLILMEVVMRRVNGLEILASLGCDPRFDHVPVLLLASLNDAEIKRAALELGATDFLTKPVDATDLLPRVRNSLLNKSYKDRLSRHAEDLEEQVRQRTAELEISRREVIYCLARAAEYRDDNTSRHVIRVGRYVGIIARELRYVRAPIDLLELAAQLHDIGKIGIPDDILKKPAKLTDEECRVMKQHCEMGLRIIRPLPADELREMEQQFGPLPAGRSQLLDLASIIADSHHERWDGTGYPAGLKGEDIPIEGRMTALADVFDALSSERPYKPVFSRERCFEILYDGRGTHFDPQVVDAFFRRIDEVVALQDELTDATG